MSPPATVQEEIRWSPDPDEAVDEFPVDMPIQDVGRIRGRQALSQSTGRLVEFGVSAQVELGGYWHTIARADTDHYEVHLHLLNKAGETISRRVIRIIRSAQDVDLGWDESVNILVEHWDEHERRWRSGR